MPKKVLFTSESVTEGHPDKIADQISDAILDSILEQDPNGRVACETIVTTGQVHVFGEITTDAKVDIPRVIRKTIGDIGYTDASYGFDSETCAILISLDEQSPDIAMRAMKPLNFYLFLLRLHTDFHAVWQKSGKMDNSHISDQTGKHK